MLCHFLTKSKHPMTLQIKDNKLFGRNGILDNYNEKILITGVCLWIKNPDPLFSRIRVTQKNRLRPHPDSDLDPDPQHW